MSDEMRSYISAGFSSGRTDEAETAATIRTTLVETGELLDPHSAVGYGVARGKPVGDVPMVTLATAHPAKFPDAVEAASGVRPALPPRMGNLMQRRERFKVLSNDLATVKQFVLDRTQAGRT